MKEQPSPEIFTPTRVIGIDPGVNTGIAILDVLSKQIVSVHTLSFWPAIELVQSHDVLSTFVVVESSSKMKMLWNAEGVTQRQAAGIARRVGKNNEQSDLLAEGLIRRGYFVHVVKPQNTKLKAHSVQEITGFTGRTSEHNRDAIMMAWTYKSPALIKGLVKSMYQEQMRKRA